MYSINPDIDWYFDKAGTWQKEIKQLRSIVSDCGLVEELKWGCPCYTLQGRNVVLIHIFKDYCALLFFKGALLQDAARLLTQQTEHVQSARQLRFTDSKEITKLATAIKAYIYEAIAVEEAGLKVQLKATADFAVPLELQQKLDELPGLKAAFSALTPGRQRAYLFYFAQAKQAKTRLSRVEKYVSHILAGKGLND